MIPQPRCPNSSTTAHARFKVVCLAEPPPIVTAILRALVGMNNSLAWSTTAYGHQHRIKYELAGYCRSRRPPDDLSGEQIHDYGEVEPALPSANVCNVGNPSFIWTRNVKVALQKVWDQFGGLGRGVVTDSIPSQCSDFIHPHQPHHTVLAASLAGLPKVEEYSGRSVDTVACRERRADQPQEPKVFEGSLTDRLLKPGVVPTRCHLQHPAHRSNVEALVVGFNEFVSLSDLPVTRFCTHRHSSMLETPLDSRVHKKLGSPVLGKVFQDKALCQSCCM